MEKTKIIQTDEKGFYNGLRVFDDKDNLLKNWTGLVNEAKCMYDDNDGYQEWNVTDTPDRDKANGYRVRDCYIAIPTEEKYTTCDGCSVPITFAGVVYENDQGYNYCIECYEAILADPESRGNAPDPLRELKQHLKNRPDCIIITDLDQPLTN